MQKFSVSMCVYEKDNPIWFKTAVDSILNQSIKPDEIIIVVDGPVPLELDNIIKSYEMSNLFKVIRFEENQGHGNARRAGLTACSNELVAIMDSDDISDKERFKKQLEIFENDNEISIVGGQVAEFVDDLSNIIGKRLVPLNDKDIKIYLRKRCPLNQPTVMFKKSEVLSVGGYIDWYCNEDYYLWIRMAEANLKMANCDSVLVNMRVTPDSYERRGGLRYFKSEKRLQNYMLNKKIINYSTYLSNVLKRFIVQILMPNKIRGWIFKKIARKQVR